jgi:molybdate transport system substrate-binding protein
LAVAKLWYPSDTIIDKDAPMRLEAFAAALLISALGTGYAEAQLVASETVRVYAAAVVKEPLTELAEDFEKSAGARIELIFDTAGATEQRFRADPGASILITNVALIRNAESSGALKGGTSTPLGSTVAGIAITPGSPKPDVSSPEKLKAALLAADRIAVSDPARGATVGTHFMKVIETLGVKNQVMPKVVLSRDGVETMRLVVEKRADLGVSQSSEILQASADSMAGPFPSEFALTTDFSLWRRNAASALVRDFAALLLGPKGREKLAADGIVPAPAK